MTVLYKLQSFEGPLDLLLHLIDKAEVEIYDIPISEITDQYIEYMNTMEELELDIASEFLVMAATLLSIKSKMLLPKPPVIEIEMDDYDPDEDPRSELVKKLIEYRKFKGIAEHLRDRELERSLVFSREPEDLTPFLPSVPENPVKGLHIADLVLAFQRALRRSVRRDKVAKIRRDEISVKERIQEVLLALQSKEGKMLFSQLLPAHEITRDDIVVTFLAILELMKIKRIICYQHGLFDDIVIQYRGEGLVDELPADEIHY